MSGREDLIALYRKEFQGSDEIDRGFLKAERKIKKNKKVKNGKTTQRQKNSD
jgi:hypothetical protein